VYLILPVTLDFPFFIAPTQEEYKRKRKPKGQVKKENPE
jgi:hypothetical protein